MAIVINGSGTVSGLTEQASNVELTDSTKIMLGTGDDLQIYHDGSDSYVKDTGDGDLYLMGAAEVLIRSATNENMIKAVANAQVNLYYDNAVKLATSAAGATVTGALTATSFAGSGASLTGLKAGTAGFSARATNQWNSINTGDFLAFNNDSTGDNFDTDSCFNTSTYKFTAPATGLYMFWYSIYTAQNDASNGFGFKINNNSINMQSEAGNFFTYHESTTNDHMQTATVVVNISSGETVGVVALAASDYYGGHAQWGGCRLA